MTVFTNLFRTHLTNHLFADENKSCNIFQDDTKSNNLEMNDNDLIISISEGPKGFGVNDKEQNEFSDVLI